MKSIDEIRHRELLISNRLPLVARGAGVLGAAQAIQDAGLLADAIIKTR